MFKDTNWVKVKLPKAGKFNNLTELFFWMVFDHFTIIWGPGFARYLL